MRDITSTRGKNRQMPDAVRVNDIDLDASFFEELLRSIYGDETIKVHGMNSSMPVAKGSNYLSNIIRVNLEYSGVDESVKKTGMIIKAIPVQSPAAMNFIVESKIFDRELYAFRNILPIMEKLVGRQIGPKLYYTSDQSTFFIMEDMATSNCMTVGRQKGFSKSYCLLSVEKIAMFHAASVAMYEKDPNCVNPFRQHIFAAESMVTFIKLVQTGILSVSREIRKWPGESWQIYANKLDKLRETIHEQLKRAFDYEKGEFCVLNHGDCWTNNILLREVDGSPLEAILIDYQTSTYASPAIDLLYFIYMCPDVSLKSTVEELLVAAYLDTLKSTMKSIGCKTRAPTMDELKAAMYKRRIFAVMSGIGLYPRTLASEEDVEDVDEMMTNLQGETKMDFFKNPDATVALQRLLPYMDRNGYLD